jgi:hypothetical protein
VTRNVRKIVGVQNRGYMGKEFSLGENGKTAMVTIGENWAIGWGIDGDVIG